MKRIQIIFILVALLLAIPASAQVDRSRAPEPGPAPRLQIGESTTFSLRNGMTVIVVENHKLPRVSFSLSLDLDPMLNPGKTGLTGFAGEIIGRGTTTRDKDQIDREIDMIGGILSTNSEGAYVFGLKKHQDKLLTLLSDVVLNPSFPEEELEKIRSEAISGLKASLSSPAFIAGNLEAQLVYGPEHPYGEIQTEETLNNITLEDCRNYWETYFKPGSAYLIAVGDITPKEAKKLAKKYFGKWSGGTAPSKVYPDPESPSETMVAVADKPGAVQTDLTLIHPVEYNQKSEDFFAARVLNQLLGGSFGARLNQNLREDKGYTYGARTRLSPDEYISSFEAGASVRTEVTDSAVTQILYELNRIREDEIPAREVRRAQNILTGSFARSLESSQRIASFALAIATLDLPDDFYEKYLERLNAVTPEEVQAAANHYIKPENAYIIAVGDVSALKEKLTPFGPVQEYDAFGQPVKEADASILDDLSAEKVLARYVEAIGGAEKLQAVTGIKMISNLEMQGQKIGLLVAKAQPNKMVVEQTLPPAFGGMTQRQMVVNGDQAQQATQQGMVAISGDELKDLQARTTIFEELTYAEYGIEVALEGVKKVNGSDAVQLTFTSPHTGKKELRSYDVESGLLVQVSQDGTTTTYEDYKEVEGIMFPHKMTITNQMGELPVTMDKVEINPEFADDYFSIQ